MSPCKRVKFRLRLVRFRICCLAGFFESVRGVVGGFNSQFGRVGVSKPPPSPQWKGETFLVRAKPTKGGGILIFLTDEDRKRLGRLIWVMTKLQGPRHQVTLSQRQTTHQTIIHSLVTSKIF